MFIALTLCRSSLLQLRCYSEIYICVSSLVDNEPPFQMWTRMNPLDSQFYLAAMNRHIYKGETSYIHYTLRIQRGRKTRRSRIRLIRMNRNDLFTSLFFTRHFTSLVAWLIVNVNLECMSIEYSLQEVRTYPIGKFLFGMNTSVCNFLGAMSKTREDKRDFVRYSIPGIGYLCLREHLGMWVSQ